MQSRINSGYPKRRDSDEIVGKRSLLFKISVHVFEIYNTELLRLMWDYNETGKREGHEDERKIALIFDDILDYAAENKRKAIYYDPHSCGVQK